MPLRGARGVLGVLGAFLGWMVGTCLFVLTAFILALVIIGSFQGCSHAPSRDLSPEAVASNDLTLAGSACLSAPGQGMDLCRVTEGATIDSRWVLVIPQGDTTGEGQLSVYFRDSVRTYAIPKGSSQFEIPWKDFFMGADKWTPEMGGVAMALLAVPYQDKNQINRVAKFRGMAYLEVLKPGYVPLPMGSQLGAWRADCHIEYSTAGRSAIRCR